MRISTRVIAVITVAVFTAMPVLAAEPADKPGVTIYATGGTIAGSSKSNTDTTDYTSGTLAYSNCSMPYLSLKTLLR